MRELFAMAALFSASVVAGSETGEGSFVMKTETE
jgi:phage/plasmid-associated DNA primase